MRGFVRGFSPVGTTAPPFNMEKTRFCDVCQINTSSANFYRHTKCAKHQALLKNKKTDEKNDIDGEHKKTDGENKPTAIQNDKWDDNESEYSSVGEYGIEFNPLDENDDFLKELNNEIFKEESEDEFKKFKQESKILQEKLKVDRLREQEAKRLLKGKPKEQPIDDPDGLFSQSGSEILGKDRRILIAKLNQYKFLFKQQLKGFKVKKGASLQELQQYLEECETIISIDGTEAFVLDGLYSALQMVEGATALTKNYDLTGLSAILRQNPQFNALMKQLMVKYNSFSKIAPEYQAIFIVVTTSYVVCLTNKQKKQNIQA